MVYESTVYPGVTENICGLILEKESGLVLGKDFKSVIPRNGLTPVTRCMC